MGLLAICGRVYDPASGIRGEELRLVLDTREGVVRELREPLGGCGLGGPGAIVLPGLVDMHVHLRGLGLSYKEDEASGTRAAARGGVTLVADMPNTVPRLDTREALLEKLERLRRDAVVEALVYAAVPRDPRLLGELLSLPGVAGLKVYPRDLGERWPAVEEALSREGLLVVLHPELPEAERGDPEDPWARNGPRGCHWETAAVETVAGALAGARLHVTHASCPSTVEAAKRSGATVDVTPHHLFMEAPRRGDCLHRVNPPLRGAAERTGLLKLLLEGAVDAVASDHAPHTPREKSGDPLACPPGIAWLEAWPHVLSCLVASGALDWMEYARLASTGPASLLGARRCLSPGCPASVTVLEPAYGRIGAPVESKARLVPYFMWRKCTETLATIVRGRIVYAAEPPRSM